jgi:hypothetical protein
MKRKRECVKRVCVFLGFGDVINSTPLANIQAPREGGKVGVLITKPQV